MMPITIDGSQGEGGGQMLRTSLGLSSILNKHLRIYNVRATRPNPGIRPQHLATLKAMATITSGRLSGAVIGSREVAFSPGAAIPGDYEFNIGTAGSVTLLMHTLLLPLSLADDPSSVTVQGGTDVPWSPTVDYYREVTLRALSRLGIEATLDVERRGFYPKGGGRAVLCIEPWKKRRPLNDATFEKPVEVTIYSSSAGLDKDVANRQASAAAEALRRDHEVREVLNTDGHGVGSSITVCGDAGALPMGFSAIGRKGYRSEDAGADAARGFLTAAGGCVRDEHLPDQMVPFLFFPPGRSVFMVPRMTGHLSTNLAIAGRFLDARWGFDGRNAWVEGLNLDNAPQCSS